jgi:hypothetical protein
MSSATSTVRRRVVRPDVFRELLAGSGGACTSASTVGATKRIFFKTMNLIHGEPSLGKAAVSTWPRE